MVVDRGFDISDSASMMQARLHIPEGGTCMIMHL